MVRFKCGEDFADISESEMELGYQRVRYFYETSHAKGEELEHTCTWLRMHLRKHLIALATKWSTGN